MTNIFAGTRFKVAKPVEYMISLNCSTRIPMTASGVNANAFLANTGVNHVAQKLCPGITIDASSDVQAVLACHPKPYLKAKKYILWGCSIADASDIDTNLIEVRALTGHESYKALGKPGEFYFDTRVLVPWALGVTRQKPDIQFCLIPGEADMGFVQLKDQLEQQGVTVIDPTANILVQLGMMARSMIILTSSITHAMYADAIGIPVHLFHSRGNKDDFVRRATEYYKGSDRVVPEILDFSTSLSISSFPKDQNGFYDIKKAMSLCPLEVKPDVTKDILEYFNEAS